jgi:hypothetical protein
MAKSTDTTDSNTPDHLAMLTARKRAGPGELAALTVGLLIGISPFISGGVDGICSAASGGRWGAIGRQFI